MKFQIDKHTIQDLEIFESNNRENSIIGLFTTSSLGGRDKLRDLFRAPFTSIDPINQRLLAIQYISDHELGIEIDKEDLDFIEHYLSRKENTFTFSNIVLEKYIMNIFRPSSSFYIIRRGIYVTVRQLKEFYNKAISGQSDQPELISQFYSKIQSTLEQPDFKFVLKLFNKEKLSSRDISLCDQLFRLKGFDRLKEILDIVYAIDVLQTAGRTAKYYNFCYPKFSNSSTPELNIEGLFHPFISEPIHNDIIFNDPKNLLFITGANMAGKSTFLKSIGVALFLAQMGFPVPATRMNTSVFHGIISSLNISDNISLGYSHFYSEVQRVKEVAIAVKNSPGIFVIFDELFRGTNVKDAFDASRLIIEAFSKTKESLFIVSSHIVEVAHELSNNKNIDFKYLELDFKDDEPVFTYKIADGITEERIGMWIIKKSEILDILAVE